MKSGLWPELRNLRATPFGGMTRIRFGGFWMAHIQSQPLRGTPLSLTVTIVGRMGSVVKVDFIR
jgi:hypothetical protein